MDVALVRCADALRLTDDEAKSVRIAIRKLRRTFGSYNRLAAMLEIPSSTLRRLALERNMIASTRIMDDHRTVTNPFEGCIIETFEQVKADLADVECALATRVGIRPHQSVRRELIALDRRGKLVEDELVARWHELYNSYIDWTRPESWEEPPRASEENEQG